MHCFSTTIVPPLSRIRMPSPGAAVLAVLLLTGCATSHTVTHEPGTYEQLNAQSEGHDVTLILADGRRAEGCHLTLAPDTTRWQPAAKSVVQRTPTMAVTQVHIHGSTAKRQTMVRYGIFVGLIVGAGLRQDLSGASSQALLKRFGTYLAGPATGLISYVGARLIFFPDHTYTLHLPPPDPPHVARHPAEPIQMY